MDVESTLKLPIFRGTLGGLDCLSNLLQLYKLVVEILVIFKAVFIIFEIPLLAKSW